ncbi:MAG: radical SAM protein [Alphaproteobacteria bacterium]|nr:radical SAM protein [Alphaproteobacteria bacterium]
MASSSPGAPSSPADAESSHATKGLLRLTMACNERCPFCNVPMEDYPRPTPTADEIAAQLDAFVATGQQTLTISGGEPTLLRKRLLALIRSARERGIPFVELQTNAVLIDETFAAALAEAGLTSAFVSLLSHDAALHDRMAGLDGAFPRCLAGIDALLAHGVRVTLNPVFGRPTQATVEAYLRFVVARLPGVRSISLSAVQPHGRAAEDPELLPDYAVLAGEVRRARAVAEAAGVELLNPYCGLPLCVGWEGAQDRSVEAIEAALGIGAPDGVDRPGLENLGDKRQGAPCRSCLLRTRCGGAWHAVWDRMDGQGIAPPAVLAPPWDDACVADRPADVVPGAVAWLRPPVLRPEDVGPILASATTDLLVELDAAALDPQGHPERDLVRALRRLDRASALRSPQARVHVWLRLSGATAAVERAMLLARSLGVHAVTLSGPAVEHVEALQRLAPEVLVTA